jgi:hypothetical protein
MSNRVFSEHDIRHAQQTHEELMQNIDEYDGPEIIMTSRGYAEVWLDGEIVQFGRVVFDVDDDDYMVLGRFTLKELEAMPTINVGHFADLKYQVAFEEAKRVFRVSLSRCTVADGEPFDNKAVVEEFVGDAWEEVYEYQAC